MKSVEGCFMRPIFKNYLRAPLKIAALNLPESKNKVFFVPSRLRGGFLDVPLIFFGLAALFLNGCAIAQVSSKNEPSLSLEASAGGDGWVTLAKGQRIDTWYYFDGKNIYCDEAGTQQMRGVDVRSFQVLPGTKYARDKQHVYYPITIPCWDGVDKAGNLIGNCYCEKYIVVGAEAPKFKYLGMDYATDGNYVFFRGEKVEGADGASVQLVKGPEYLYCVKDKARVFIYKKILPLTEPKTFQYWRTENDNTYFLKDAHHVWKVEPPGFPILVQ
jgi:hypothetical protein